MSRTLSITLPADIAHTLEVRAAIDDQTLPDGIQALLVAVVEQWRART